MTDLVTYERAAEVQREILQGTTAIRTAWTLLGAKLAQFAGDEMWRALGFDSFKAWCTSPEIELSESHCYKLISLHRELVIERQVPVEDLRGLDAEKVVLALPAVRRNEVTIEEVLSDARVLSRSDMRERYRGGRSPNAGLDAEEERPFHTCSCGHVHRDQSEAA